MDLDAIANARRIMPDLFGNTDIAGGIPDTYRPSPSNGSVYFEGRFILVLSFQDDGKDTEVDDDTNTNREPIDTLALWDCLADTWFTPNPFIIRYEDRDTVLIDSTPIYTDTVNNSREVTLVPQPGFIMHDYQQCGLPKAEKRRFANA